MNIRYTLRDLQNTRYLEVLTKVVNATSVCRQGTHTDGIILENFGTYLQQNAWTDDTGWFIEFRCCPSAVFRNPSRRKELIDTYLAELAKNVFVNPKMVKLEELGPELTDNVRVTYHIDTHSIGD